MYFIPPFSRSSWKMNSKIVDNFEIFYFTSIYVFHANNISTNNANASLIKER